jgi:hypothetical protein
MSRNKLSKPEQPDEPRGEILLYKTGDGQVRVQCLFMEENLWLTQKALAELFGVKIPAVSKHLKNIFDSGELVEKSVVSILETAASDGNMTFSKNVRTGSISPISIVKSDA